MHYPSSENKGADQLRGYREADLRLCFRLGKNPVFSRCGSKNIIFIKLYSSTPVLFDLFVYLGLTLHSFFSHAGTEPPLHGKLTCIVGRSRVLLNDTNKI